MRVAFDWDENNRVQDKINLVEMFCIFQTNLQTCVGLINPQALAEQEQQNHRSLDICHP